MVSRHTPGLLGADVHTFVLRSDDGRVVRSPTPGPYCTAHRPASHRRIHLGSFHAFGERFRVSFCAVSLFSQSAHPFPLPQWVFTLGLVLSSVVDFLITGGLCYYLRRSRTGTGRYGPPSVNTAAEYPSLTSSPPLDSIMSSILSRYTPSRTVYSPRALTTPSSA